MSLKIFAPAQVRIVEIWHYTFSAWGVEQADSYVNGLNEFLFSLGDFTSSGRLVKGAGIKDVYQVRYRSHYVFFKHLPNGGIGILTILHGTMDIPNRLKADIKGAK